MPEAPQPYQMASESFQTPFISSILCCCLTLQLFQLKFGEIRTLTGAGLHTEQLRHRVFVTEMNINLMDTNGASEIMCGDETMIQKDLY